MPLFFLAESAAVAASNGQETAIASIIIAIVTAISGIILAIVRRGPKTAATVKQVSAHGTTLTEHGKSLAEHNARLDEHNVRLDELEQLIEATDPDVQSRNDRLAKLEAEVAAERAAREARRETQAAADTALAVAFARLDESIKNIKEKVESHNGNGRRSR